MFARLVYHLLYDGEFVLLLGLWDGYDTRVDGDRVGDIMERSVSSKRGLAAGRSVDAARCEGTGFVTVLWTG